MKKQLIFVSIFFLNSLIFADNISVGNSQRSYIKYSPASITSNRPLVISLHGMNQSATYQQETTNWNAIADSENLTVIFPQGVNNAWDISGTGDLNFLTALIAEMKTKHQIDENRIYLSGFSMGGMMTYHAMNSMSSVFAAFGPVSGYMSANFTSDQPVNLFHIHGTSDDVVPYAAGNSAMTGAYFPGALSMVEGWAKRNNCDLTPTTQAPYPSTSNNQNSLKTFSNCDSNTQIQFASLNGKGHWHSNDAAAFHTTNELWKFFKAHSKEKKSIPRTPFANSNLSIPGKIEFEHFDNGDNGVSYLDNSAGSETQIDFRNDGDVDIEACTDVGQGYNIGYATSGEWLEYSVIVEQTGLYDVEIRYAVNGEGRTIDLSLDGNEMLSGIQLENTGDWQSWASMTTTPINLTKGNHTLRVTIGSADYVNLNYMSFLSSEITSNRNAKINTKSFRVFSSKGEYLGSSKANALEKNPQNFYISK